MTQLTWGTVLLAYAVLSVLNVRSSSHPYWPPVLLVFKHVCRNLAVPARFHTIINNRPCYRNANLDRMPPADTCRECLAAWAIFVYAQPFEILPISATQVINAAATPASA